ncbi:MAG: SpoIIE family protein phosphatase [Bdellovibrionales bacterium]|nr:SpoIIE family protein phosphatase [Bdellovibrionales bacterium]
MRGNPMKAVTVFTSAGQCPFIEEHAEVNRDRGILVLADGFGGPVAGADAARSACTSVRQFLEKEAGDEEATLPFVLRGYYSLAGNVLFNALVHANRSVRKLNVSRNVHEKGGASVAAGYLDGNLLALASVGACQAWLFRGGRSGRLLTPRDYSWLRDPLTEDPEPQYRAPLAALGMHEDLEPEIVECQVRPGDWLLIHSGGLGGAARGKLLELHQDAADEPGVAERARRVLEDTQNRGEFQSNCSALLALF